MRFISNRLAKKLLISILSIPSWRLFESIYMSESLLNRWIFVQASQTEMITLVVWNLEINEFLGIILLKKRRILATCLWNAM